MHTQRITVTTMQESCADDLFRVLLANGQPLEFENGYVSKATPMPSFTNLAGERFTVSHVIPCESGNRPLTNVWRIVAQHIACCVIDYRSDPT